jgi:hypothetical protein
MKTVLLLIGFVLAIGHSAEAQQSDKVWRIGYLDPSTHSLTMGFLEAFREEMKKLGWIEGKNIIIENRFAESAATPLVREWSMRIRAAGMKSIISFFEAQGFTVASVPWEDPHHKRSDAKAKRKTLEQCRAAALREFDGLPKPVLLQCSAGIDRSAPAAAFIWQNRSAV